MRGARDILIFHLWVRLYAQLEVGEVMEGSWVMVESVPWSQDLKG